MATGKKKILRNRKIRSSHIQIIVLTREKI